MTRLFIPFSLMIDHTITIEGAPFNHAVRVLRKKTGDTLVLFNGEGGEYSATISTINKREMIVVIEAFHDIDRESIIDIHLVQSIAKGEKMDFIIQKSVELGVKSITPLMSERSIVALDNARIEKRLAHWQSIIESACEQSGRTRCPDLYTPIKSPQLRDHLLPIPYLIFEPKAPQTFASFIHSLPLQPITALGIIIGPEGGFSEDELTLFKGANVSPIALGKRILRTETAALSIMGAIHALVGDWQ